MLITNFRRAAKRYNSYELNDTKDLSNKIIVSINFSKPTENVLINLPQLKKNI